MYPSDWSHTITIRPYQASSLSDVSTDLKILLLINPMFANYTTAVKPDYTTNNYIVCEFGRPYEISSGVGSGVDQYIMFMISNPRFEGSPCLPTFDVYSKSRGLYNPSSDKYYALFGSVILYN